MCFSLKRRESMIIVDPFVICRRGGGCIWIRSKLSECDMCSMRQGHRATGQTISFHAHFCYIFFIFWKLDFIVRKKCWRNWVWNFVTKWHKVTIFWENLTMFSWSSCITPGKIHTGCQLHYVKGSSRDTTVMLTHQPFCTKNYNHLFPSRFVLPSKNPIQKLDSRIICWLQNRTHSVWKSPKMSHLSCSILAISTN